MFLLRDEVTKTYTPECILSYQFGSSPPDLKAIEIANNIKNSVMTLNEVTQKDYLDSVVTNENRTRLLVSKLIAIDINNEDSFAASKEKEKQINHYSTKLCESDSIDSSTSVDQDTCKKKNNEVLLMDIKEATKPRILDSVATYEYNSRLVSKDSGIDVNNEDLFMASKEKAKSRNNFPVKQ